MSPETPASACTVMRILFSRAVILGCQHQRLFKQFTLVCTRSELTVAIGKPTILVRNSSEAKVWCTQLFVCQRSRGWRGFSTLCQMLFLAHTATAMYNEVPRWLLIMPGCDGDEQRGWKNPDGKLVGSSQIRGVKVAGKEKPPWQLWCVGRILIYF